MTGAEVRMLVYGNGLKLWQVAEGLGIRDDSFSRKLRHDLSDEDTQKILAIVEKLKA